MPRDITGTYSLPAGNPVVSGEVITSEWANDTLSDIADALTESYCIDGRTPLDGPLELISGSAVAPSLTYQAETTTGLYRIGAGQVAFTGLSNYLGRVGSALTEFLTDSFKIKNAAGSTTLLETTASLFKTLNVEISATLIKLFSTAYSFSASAMTLAPSTTASVTSTTTTVEGSSLTLTASSSGTLDSPSFVHTGALNRLQNNVMRVENGETRIIADTSWPTTLRGLTGQSYASRTSVGSAVCGHYKRTARTSSGTHTVSNGTRMIIVELVGGGGGGGTCGSQGASYGGQSCAGGGGAYCMGIITSIASSYSVTVGAGGTAGASGGTSSMGSFSAGGGAGGAAAPADQILLTSPVAQRSWFGGNGGSASGGLIMISGEDGQASFFGMPVVNYAIYAPAPRGGSSGNGWGFGGWVSFYGGGGGSNTPGYGGGGGGKTGAGGSPTQTGQTGGDGIVVIWEFF
jgi:hypothetical protein